MMSEQMFFAGAPGVWRTLLVGLCAYVLLILVLRTTGKRTLSKMNAFDLIVTVALGSTLATVILSKDVALAEGVTAFVMLAGAQLPSRGSRRGRSASEVGSRPNRQSWSKRGSCFRMP
jgi:beta-lactamase regulating signal transducer with metallopeptidase domain